MWPPGESCNVVLVSGVRQNDSFVLLDFGFDDEEEMVAAVSTILSPNTYHSGCSCWMPR